jgi:hypothetical protein
MYRQLGIVYTVKWTVCASKQMLIDSYMIDVCSRSSFNAPESIRRKPQVSKITKSKKTSLDPLHVNSMKMSLINR